MIEPPKTTRLRPGFLGATRLLVAVTAGFSATIACVAAATEPSGPASADVHPLTSADPRGQVANPGDPGAAALAEGDSGAPSADGGKPDGGCPYGALEDPHRGFVRCLSQGEKSPFESPGSAMDGGPPGDAQPPDGGGILPPDGGNPDGGAPLGDAGAGNNASPPDGGSDAAAPSAAPSAPPPPAPGPPPLVEMKTPKFENGDVPKAEKNLSGKKVLEAVAKCVADNGGLTGKTGTLKVEFLVRARGKAEGVEVKATGVSEEAGKCVRNFLKNRSMGTPTADPTGVTVVYNLKPAGK